MLLLIDNYDSFVHNLARYFVELGCDAHVVRNDAISLADVRKFSPAAIVISPGPCTPLEAGVSMDLIRELGASIPMLGVCLGHQAIAAVPWGADCSGSGTSSRTDVADPSRQHETFCWLAKSSSCHR